MGHVDSEQLAAVGAGGDYAHWLNVSERNEHFECVIHGSCYGFGFVFVNNFLFFIFTIVNFISIQMYDFTDFVLCWFIICVHLQVLELYCIFGSCP